MNLLPMAPSLSEEERTRARLDALKAARARRLSSRPVRDLADLVRQLEDTVLECADELERRRAANHEQWWRAQDDLDAAVDLLDAVQTLQRGEPLPADAQRCDEEVQGVVDEPVSQDETAAPCKQVLVVRRDLNMPRGKIAAQASHGAVNALLRGPGAHRVRTAAGEELRIPLSEPVRRWLGGEYRKIGLAAHSEAELLELAHRARAAGVRCEEVWDNGLTMFEGRKTLTALALGPDEDGRLDALTGELKLL